MSCSSLPPISDSATSMTMTTPVKTTVVPSSSAVTDTTENDGHFTPEQVRPHPKAGSRKGKVIRRKKKSVILTDTPVKMQISIDMLSKAERKSRKSKSTVSKKSKSIASKKNEQSDTDCSDVNIQESDDSDIDFVEEFSGDDEPNQMYLNFGAHDIKDGDFLLVKYDSKISTKYFVGKVCQVVDDLFEVTFLTRQPTKSRLPLFTFPDNEDKDQIQFEDIVMKLPQPSPIGGTARASKQLKFDINLSSFF